ncbi:MAG TPA: DUF1513 domain-containing protein [Bdellovibrio sp.]|uniref:DUF1513 domain-containing protein n=1 Tax=Bdellovibrio sp. TaxID=28201 RepID=UPI002EE6C5C3
MESSVNVNRRNFLISSLVGAGLLYLAAKYRLSSNHEHHDKILATAAGTPTKTTIYQVAPSGANDKIIACHVSTGKIQAIPVPVNGHQISQHPFDKRLIFTSEKWGEAAALVDLKNEKVLQLIKSEPGTRFFGHSIFSADGKYIICSEIDDKVGTSFLGVRDYQTLKLINKIPSHGIFAHQLRSPDNGKTVLVVNSGVFHQSYAENAPHWKNSPDLHEDGRFNHIDLESGKLLKSTSLGEAGFAHFAFDHNDGSSVVIGNARPIGNPSLISIVKNDGTVIDLRETKAIDYIGEALSVEMDTKNKVAYVTIPDRNLLLQIDYKNNQLLGHLNLEYVRGLAVDQDRLFTSSIQMALAQTTSSKTSMQTWNWQKWNPPGPIYGAHLALLDSYLK